MKMVLKDTHASDVINACCLAVFLAGTLASLL